MSQKYIDTLNNEIEKGFQEMENGLGKDSKEMFKNDSYISLYR